MSDEEAPTSDEKPKRKEKYRPDLRKNRVRSVEYKERHAERMRERRAKQKAEGTKPVKLLGTAHGNRKNVQKEAPQSVVLRAAVGNLPLSPGQVAHLRGKIAQIIRDNLVNVEGVLSGEVQWSPTQARVFGNLLNKVIPDLSASFHQHEHKNQDLKELSRAELERIALGLDDIETVDAEFTDVTPEPEPSDDDHQPPEASDPLDPDLARVWEGDGAAGPVDGGPGEAG